VKFGLAEFLLRFRRLATPPGLAGPTAVAVDRTADIALELAPLLEAIDEIEDEADAIERGALERCHSRAAMAESEARRLLLESERQAADVRAEILADHRRTRARESLALVRRARAEAARIEGTAADRAPELVDRAVACIRVPRP
jgi:vacuolar-type H+-ATPase subunit H